MLDGPGDALRSRSRRSAAVHRSSGSARRSTVALPSSAAYCSTVAAPARRAPTTRKGARSSAPSHDRRPSASHGAPQMREEPTRGASRPAERERSAIADWSPSTRPPLTLRELGHHRAHDRRPGMAARPRLLRTTPVDKVCLPATRLSCEPGTQCRRRTAGAAARAAPTPWRRRRTARRRPPRSRWTISGGAGAFTATRPHDAELGGREERGGAQFGAPCRASRRSPMKCSL